MGRITRQRPVKLITSLIYRDAAMLERAEERLKRMYGPLEAFGKTLPFDYTDYYFQEFGNPLWRKMICFRKMMSVENISGVKLATNALEDRLREHGKRTVNIDPGYLNDAKLVLLTTKDYIHRIHIGKCVFAESTLYFKGGSFRSWPWSYRDYASPEMVEYFNAVRKIYLKDIAGRDRDRSRTSVPQPQK